MKGEEETYRVREQSAGLKIHNGTKHVSSEIVQRDVFQLHESNVGAWTEQLSDMFEIQ